MSLPSNPHCIIEIERPGFVAGDGQAKVVWDSWEQTKIFESVEVELVTNESSQAVWTFFDPKFRILDAFAGEEGVSQATVRVYLGYGQELGEPIFKGLLAQIRRQESSTEFIAFDMGFKMKLIKRAGYKNGKDDLEIIKALAARNGLKFEGPAKKKTLEKNKSAMQDEQTDWEWAMERARDSGLVLFVRQDTLFAKYPAQVGTPVLTLINRKDFILQAGWSFLYKTPENQDGRPRVVRVRRRGRGGRRSESQSDVSTRGRESLVLKQDGESRKSKLTKRAQAQKELEREHAFEGNIEILSPPDATRLDVRNTVEVLEVGKLFSGKYICDAVSYNFSPGNLGLTLDLYRDFGNV